MEEWLTDFRNKLLKKCQVLLKEKFIVNVKTKDGDIIIYYNDNEGVNKKKVVVTQEDYDELLKLVGKNEKFDPLKDGLSQKSDEGAPSDTNETTVKFKAEDEIISQ